MIFLPPSLKHLCSSTMHHKFHFLCLSLGCYVWQITIDQVAKQQTFISHSSGG